MLKIRRPLGCLIFNMGIAIPGKTVFLIETAPWMFQAFFIVHAHWGLTYPHDDVIKWKPFPHYHDYWPFVRGIYRSPVNSPHKGQWRGALMFSLICTWINGWVNNGEAGDLRHRCTQYDVTVMHCLQKQRQVKKTVGQMDFGKVFSYTLTEKKNTSQNLRSQASEKFCILQIWRLWHDFTCCLNQNHIPICFIKEVFL